jgi:hypothetical protein
MPHGGRRPGAGRRRGSRNKTSKSKSLALELREKAQAAGISPLDYLCSIYRDESQPQQVRMAAAEMSLPYLHPKLSMIAVDQRTEVGVISPEEQTRLEEERRRKALAEIEFAFRERAPIIDNQPVPAPPQPPAQSEQPAAQSEQPAASGEEPPPPRPRESARPSPLAAEPRVERLPVRYRPLRPLGNWSG